MVKYLFHWTCSISLCGLYTAETGQITNLAHWRTYKMFYISTVYPFIWFYSFRCNCSRYLNLFRRCCAWKHTDLHVIGLLSDLLSHPTSESSHMHSIQCVRAWQSKYHSSSQLEIARLYQFPTLFQITFKIKLIAWKHFKCL